IKSVGKGLLKVMSKMGISTYQSYCGAQIFDAVGLSSDFVARYFTGTATTIAGVDLDAVAEGPLRRHTLAFGDDAVLRRALDVGGEYAYRMRGEAHTWDPNIVASLQHAVRLRDETPETAQQRYDDYARMVNGENARFLTIRSMFGVNP